MTTGRPSALRRPHEVGGGRELVGDATWVVRSGTPARSGVPRRSRSGARPATPIATSVVPCRNGRPNESVTMTATSTPAWLAKRRPDPRALASGSSGSRMTVPGSAAFEWSTPAEAQTKPWRVSAITRPPRERTTRSVSAEDHLELPEVGLRARRALARAARARSRRARRPGPRPSRRPSGRRRRRRRARSVGRGGDQRAEVGALADLGEALDREDLDHAPGMPVTVMPACAR